MNTTVTRFLSSILSVAGLVAATGHASPTNETKPAAAPIPTPIKTTGEGVLLDGIMVTVGDEVILLSDMQKAIRVASNGQTRLEAGGKLIGGPVDEKEAGKILDQLIDQRILAMQVREMNLTISEEDLDVEIDNFLKGQNVTREKFMDLLKQEGETYPAYREEFRRQLETQRFVGRVIRPLVSVTDDELKSFYLQQAGATDKPQKIKLRSLVINVPGELDPKQKTKQALVVKVQKELAAGGDFVDLVKKYSESPDAPKTEGILSPKSPGELPKDVWKALKETKQGGYAGPFQIGSGAFFFQNLGYDLNNLADFDKRKKELETKLLDTKFQERLNEYLRAERTKTKIVKSDIRIAR